MHHVQVVSFGYLHDTPPTAHLTVDLRSHFRDPHVNPALRELTALDRPVRDAVLGTPGIRLLLTAVTAAVLAYQVGPSAGPIVVAVGCAGGRHRAPVVADALADALSDHAEITVTHRDLARPVVHR